MGQKLEPVYHPRTGTGKIAAGIHRMTASTSNRGQPLPVWIARQEMGLAEDFLQMKSAGAQYQHLRGIFQYLLPGKPDGILSLSTQSIHPPSQFHQLRHPVPSIIGRREPFHAEDAGARGERQGPIRNGLHTSPKPPDQPVRLVRPACGLAYLSDIVKNFLKTGRGQIDDLRGSRKKTLTHPPNLITRGSTDLA